MKKTCAILLTLLTLGNPIVPSSARIPKPKPIPIPINEKERRFILDVLTIYNPSVNQCDPTPLVTASNARINLEELRSQKLRWMALSRELLIQWNGEFRYGDTVRVIAKDPSIDGLWVIQDTMNRRFKSRGDLLFDSSTRKWGRWENVEIMKNQAQR